MADIQNFHGNPFIGAMVNIASYLIFLITGSGLALGMTILSAAVVFLANLPKAIQTIKSYYDRVVKKDRDE